MDELYFFMFYLTKIFTIQYNTIKQINIKSYVVYDIIYVCILL